MPGVRHDAVGPGSQGRKKQILASMAAPASQRTEALSGRSRSARDDQGLLGALPVAAGSVGDFAPSDMVVEHPGRYGVH